MNKYVKGVYFEKSSKPGSCLPGIILHPIDVASVAVEGEVVKANEVEGLVWSDGEGGGEDLLGSILSLEFPESKQCK